MNIDITVSPDAFEFRTLRRSVVLKTFVHVAREAGSYRVVGFSDDSSPALGVAVRLFDGPCEVPAMRPMFLCELIKHGIMCHRDEFWLIKPVVVFHNVRSLDQVLHGFQETLLEPLAIEAGARKVIFSPR